MHVHIFWDSLSPAGLQMPVARSISSVLGVETSVSDNHVRISGLDMTRKQVDARALLDSVQAYKRLHGIADPVLLVVHQDLFREGNRYVFGLARESVGAGVVSTARLNNEYYGLRGSDDDFIDRIVKEGAHEIGHLLGLPHCPDGECVMFRPDTLDDLDRKKKVVCPACRELLDQRLAAYIEQC
jgi:archaemetzincin